MPVNKIQPQPGPQTEFLSSKADIAIYGGAAGSGKTFGVLLETLRHISIKDFNAVIFRRTTPEIRNAGGLWDESNKIFPLLQAIPKESTLDWKFKSGAKISFRHLEYEKNVHDFQGSQIPLVIFDELTHFTQKQFFYMLSRNRSMCGVKPYVRATTNPDCDSWVREFVDWWIDPDTGLPIKDRSGIIRWFIRIDDSIVWGDSREELIEEYGQQQMPKSVTFISASIYDNPALLAKDPGYLANLKALNKIDRERLLDGNWNARAAAGEFFKREWFEIIEPHEVPIGISTVRFWDRAATEKTQTNNPDFTAGLKLSKDGDGIFYIEDVLRFQYSPGKVTNAILNTASYDGDHVTVGLSQDPGQAGKFEIESYLRDLIGYRIYTMIEQGDKETRAKPVSAQAEHGRIKVVRGKWNKAFFDEVEAFPEKKAKKDQVDALSGAFSFFTANKVGKFGKPTQDKKGTIAGSLNSGKKW